MSIINTMLQDLEKREKIPINSEIAISGLSSAETIERDHKKIISITIGIILIFGTILFASYNWDSKPEALGTATLQEIPRTIAQDNIISFPIVSERPATLSGVSLETNRNITELRFFLNNNIHYMLSTNNQKNQLKLTLENTKLIADIPRVDYLKSAIKGMQMTSDKAGNLIITFNLQAGAEISYLNMVPGEKTPELRMSITYNSPQATTASNFSVKKTGEFNAKLQYENALNDINSGKYTEAIPLLNNLLQQYPEDFNVREALIGCLLRQGQIAQAYSLLEMGLQLKPYYPPFIQIKAHFLMNKNKIIQALNLLERAPPSIRQYPDYYAFMAALYRETGRHAKALKIYQKLVQLNPHNATFWAGLGIALENNGHGQEAKKVYIRAEQLGGLNSALESYLESRIDKLT